MRTARLILMGCLLGVLGGLPLSATTIIPYANLGDMALAADAVVVMQAGTTRLEPKGDALCRRTPFQVVDVIKGNLNPGESIDLDSWWQRSGDRETAIWGDPVYEDGTIYLIFLGKLDHAPFWQPTMLAYGQFYLRRINGVDFFFPSRESREIHAFPRPDGVVPETMKVMLAQDLVQHLRQVVTGKMPWQEKLVLPEGEVKDLEVDMRAPPGHCTFLDFGGNTYARYINLPSDDILIYSQLGGDPSLSPATLAHAYVSDAATELNAEYQGIDLNYSGTFSFTPTCGANPAYGGNFYNEVPLRADLVIYDDPCDDINDLSINGSNQCSGTLAIGGLYAGGSHMFDGVTWYNGLKSYVVVNNDLGVCTNIDYTIVLIHELTHGLGLGHIDPSDGDANMNPSCCEAISALDIDCLDYTYPPAPLPVELVSFQAVPAGGDVLLTWSTASEIRNDHFDLERSSDGARFSAIGQVAGQGTTGTPTNYSWTDQNPGPGQWYYRLRQVDLDGQATYSPVVTIFLEGDAAVSRVYPNPVGGQTITVQRQAPAESDVQVDIISLDQTVVKQHRLHQRKGANLWEIVLPNVQPGVYLLRLVDDRQTEVIRFMVAHD